MKELKPQNSSVKKEGKISSLKNEGIETSKFLCKKGSNFSGFLDFEIHRFLDFEISKSQNPENFLCKKGRNLQPPNSSVKKEGKMKESNSSVKKEGKSRKFLL